MVGRISTSYFFALAIAISAAFSRAAAIVNFARSSRASVLRTFFGAAKSCSTVIIFFKFAPDGRLVARRPPCRQSNSALDRGHLMAKMAAATSKDALRKPVLGGVDQFDAEVDCVAGDGAASSRFAAAAHSNASFNSTNCSLGSSASLAACRVLHANELNSSTVLMMAFPCPDFGSR
jgi:hypothetical protein